LLPSGGSTAAKLHDNRDFGAFWLLNEPAARVGQRDRSCGNPRTRNVGVSRDYFLKTERLGFDRWHERDLPLAMGLWGNAKVSSLIGGPFTADEVRARLGREIEWMAVHGVQYWPVSLLQNGEFAGCAGLRPYRLEEQIFEMGVHLRPENWGRGLAQEAGRALIAFAFETLGAKALFAGHHPANAASRRLIEKLGFRFTHEELYPPTGLNHPSYLLTNPGTSLRDNLC
jgi:[ribosomal protein S5]-alanine N-acetyltransferase